MNKTKVPNQRTITVNRTDNDKKAPFLFLNHYIISEAAFRLRSVGGFKLYIYILRAEPNKKFDLFSSDFMKWSGLSRTAYTTAFNELVSEGYLVLKEGTNTVYTFYPESQKKEEAISIEIAPIPEDTNCNTFVF
jgi:hypothetical protein